MTNKERKLSNEILFKENLKICSTCIKIKSLNEYGIDKAGLKLLFNDGTNDALIV